MRPAFLPPNTELHPDLMRRQNDFRRLITWVFATFTVVAVTFFAAGYLVASYWPSSPSPQTFQPVKVIT